MPETYTLHEACNALAIDSATLFRWMKRALKYGWPIDNFQLLTGGEDGQAGQRQQARLTEAVQSFEPLTAPFETIAPFLHSDFYNTGDAHIAHWLIQQYAL